MVLVTQVPLTQDLMNISPTDYDQNFLSEVTETLISLLKYLAHVIDIEHMC